ncbi:MAG: SMI1/KNR4 family protein [Planctomycetes bacterium]|nr:SMI1/KNR4 family protein [Planctomycetota bacterium]
MSVDVAKLQQEFGITFPAEYVAALAAISKTCTDWPDQYRNFGDRLITDTERLRELNRDCREHPSKYIRTPPSIARAWPKELFIFGGIAGSECPYWCFDASQGDPMLLPIHKSKKLEEDGGFKPKRFRDLTEQIRFSYTQIRKAVRQRAAEERQRERAKAASRGAPRTVERPDLIAEGWALARPALRLGAAGEKYAAVWGGEGVAAPPSKGEWRHWISVACGRLPLNPRGLKGVISIYEQIDDKHMRVRVMHDETRRLPRSPDGAKLYGSPFRCLPSIGVVLSQGGKSVRQWLRAQEIWSGDAEGALFEDQEPVDEYEAEFQSNHPHFLGDCDAMLGGWNVVFPDSDWRRLMKRSLLASTFRDAEPWVEAFDSGKSFSAFLRIT